MSHIAALVDALDLHAERDLGWVEHVLAELPASYGHRAALAEVTRATLEQRFPHVLDAWSDFAARLPRYAPFSMRPSTETFLLCCRAASLVYPDRPLREAFRQFTLDSFDAIVESPVLRPLFLACEGDPGRFFEATARTNGLVDNFGQRSLERLAERHYAFVLDGWPHAYADAIIVPYLEAILRMFERPGAVRIEPPDPHSGRVVIEVAWD